MIKIRIEKRIFKVTITINIIIVIVIKKIKYSNKIKNI